MATIPNGQPSSADRDRTVHSHQHSQGSQDSQNNVSSWKRATPYTRPNEKQDTDKRHENAAHEQSQQQSKGPEGAADREKKRPSEMVYASDLNCNDKYKSTVPDIPLDPKMIEFPFDRQRFFKYRTSTLEARRKFQVHEGTMVPVGLELIDPHAYVGNMNARLHNDDLELVQDEPKDKAKSSKRSNVHGMHVNWLIKTRYVSTEVASMGDNLAGKAQSQGLPENRRIQLMDRTQQIAIVEASFQKIKDHRVFKHPKKKLRKAVSVIPVLPDIKNAQRAHTLVVFPSEPSKTQGDILRMEREYGNVAVTPKVEEEKKRRAEGIRKNGRLRMSKGILHSMVDSETQEAYVGYFVPTEKVMAQTKDKLDEIDNDVEYEHVRNYTWRVNRDEDNGPPLFFTEERDSLRYCPIDADIALKGIRANDSALETEFRKTIRTREFNRAENSSALKRRDSMRRDLEHDNRDSDDSCREGSRAGSLEPRNGDDSS